MPGNQSLNRCLYVLLTHVLLGFPSRSLLKIRTVSMKRKSICKQILLFGLGLAAPMLLLGIPIHAQQSTHADAPPGMEEGGGPFSGVMSHGPSTFGGPQAPANGPAVS